MSGAEKEIDNSKLYEEIDNLKVDEKDKILSFIIAKKMIEEYNSTSDDKEMIKEDNVISDDEKMEEDNFTSGKKSWSFKSLLF